MVAGVERMLTGETHHPTVVLKNTSQTFNCSPEKRGEETNTCECPHVHVTTPHTLLFNITHKRQQLPFLMEDILGNVSQEIS